MAEGKLETLDFDTYISLSAKAQREAVITSDDAFVAAMNRAIRKGRESAEFGIFVDLTPTFGRRIYGAAAMSSCGSPAAMCLEAGGAHIGAETMR
jgi:hypothetical protein